MTDAPKMNAYMVALSFEKGPLLINAVMAATDWAATAIVATAAVQQLGITENLMGCNVQQLMPEFLDIARGGGAPATVLSIVPEPKVQDDVPLPSASAELPMPSAEELRAQQAVKSSMPGLQGYGWRRSMPEDEPPGAA